MSEFRVRMKAGDIQRVPGRKFSHYIGGVQYWFFYHEGLSEHGLTVSALDSGLKVLHVPINSRMAALGDDKLACKAEIDKLIARVGADRVRCVIDAALKLDEVQHVVD